MNTKLILTTVTAILFLTGCDGPLLSLHPLYTKDDLASDPALKGAWQMGEDCVLRIRQSAKSADDILCLEDGVKTKYTVHVVQLAGSQFLDLVQEDTNNEWNVPAHAFALLVPLTRDEMRMSLLGSDWLDREIAARGVPHELVGENDTIVLTASTRELQQLVLSYVGQPEAFEEHGDVLHRLP